MKSCVIISLMEHKVMLFTFPILGVYFFYYDDFYIVQDLFLQNKFENYWNLMENKNLKQFILTFSIK
jgi:hypothetical protein